MKKTFGWLIGLTITVLAFVACSSDDDDNGGGNSRVTSITAQVEKGSTYNSVVDSAIVDLWWEDEEGYGREIITRSAYKNGGFTLNLPDNLDDAFLADLADNMPDGVTISDETVKIVDFSEVDAYKDGSYVGFFERSNIDLESISEEDPTAIISAYTNGIWQISYLYANKPVTIKGTYNYTEKEGGFTISATATMNVSLQKGWNVVAAKMTVNFQTLKGTIETTSSNPSGLKWFGHIYSPNYSKAKAPAPAKKSKSFWSFR